jgi:PQQ-dependent catabolism-associated CXXCW motif protein
MISSRSTSLLIAIAVAGLVATDVAAQNSFGQAVQQPYQQPQQRPQQQQMQRAPQSGAGVPMQQGMPGGMQQGMPGGMQQGMPPQAGGQQGSAQPGFGQPRMAPGQGGAPDRLTQMERQDFGVQPTAQLHSGPMHGPTPVSIPGGQTITTKGLVEMMQRQQMPVLVLDVLGGAEIIPGAQFAVPAHQAGSFNDPVQQQFGQYLQQATRGNKEHPLVLYCLSPQCWMSYNAALRAIRLGYKNVLWYRGGIESWKQAGLQVQRVQ